MADAHRQIGCPRCGYDLRGHTLAWAESCPLRGTCPECGLGFEWVQVLRPELNDWPALVEHAPAGLPSVFRASWRTWAWAASHAGFWRRLRLDHRVRLLRLVLWPILLLLLLHLAASAAATALSRQAASARFPGPTGNVSWSEVVSNFTYPLGIVSGPPFQALMLYECGYSGWLLPNGAWLNPFVDRWPWWIVTALSTHAAYALLMLVLPTTRRLAKVRSAHIGRAFVYGLWWLVPLAAFRLVRNLVLAAGVAVGLISPLTVRMTRLNSDSLTWVGLAVMSSVGVWWWQAMKRGWRLPQPRLAWSLLTVAALLAGAVIFVLCTPYWMLA